MAARAACSSSASGSPRRDKLLGWLASGPPPAWKPTRSAAPSTTSRSAAWRSGGIFDYEGRKERLTEVLRELEDPTLWTSQQERAQELGRERTRLEGVVGTLDRLQAGLSEAGELLELAEAEADAGTVASVQRDVDRIESEVARLEFPQHLRQALAPALVVKDTP